MPVPSDQQDRLRALAELSDDEKLARIASTGKIPISLAHLRDRDAETLVRVGYRISYGCSCRT